MTPRKPKPRPVRCWALAWDGRPLPSWARETRHALADARWSDHHSIVRCLLVPDPPKPRKGKGGAR